MSDHLESHIVGRLVDTVERAVKAEATIGQKERRIVELGAEVIATQQSRDSYVSTNRELNRQVDDLQAQRGILEARCMERFNVLGELRAAASDLLSAMCAVESTSGRRRKENTRERDKRIGALQVQMGRAKAIYDAEIPF